MKKDRCQISDVRKKYLSVICHPLSAICYLTSGIWYLTSIALVLFILVPSTGWAQVNIEARLNRDVLALNEQAELEVSVSGETRKISAPQIGEIEGFRIAGSGRSQNISIINGKISSSSVFSYVLSPQRTGEFTIGPFTVKHKGKVYKTDPLKIRVVESREQEFKSYGEKKDIKKIPELFVEQSVDKNKVYLGQQITYTFKFYRRIRLLSNPSFQAPDFNGFLSEDLPPNRNYRARVGGMEYIVTEVKYGLFPIRSGSIEIPPGNLTVTVNDISSRYDDFFSSFFSTGKRKNLTTNRLKVEVMPLPRTGRPMEFSGGVGRFDMNVELDKTSVKQGEPVTLQIKISGEGDPRPMKEPQLEGLTNFRVYETVTSEDIQKKNYKVLGSKVFRTLIVPQVAGKLNIPGIIFSYFDPVNSTYKVIKSKPLILNVSPSPELSESEKESRMNISRELSVVREDIRYITSDRGRTESKPLYRRKGFWVVEGIPLYLWVFSLLFNITHKKVFLPRYPKLRKIKEIKKSLRESQKLVKQGENLEVYRKIEKISKKLDKLPHEIQEIVQRAKFAVYSPDKESLSAAGNDLKKFMVFIKRGLKLVFWVLFFYAVGVFSLHAGDLFSDANKYFQNGKFKKAANTYLEILENEENVESVLYNLGNAYWRLGEIGAARLFWEKALKLNPGNRDAEYNIELVSKSIDEKEMKGFIDTLSDAIGAFVPANGMVIVVSVFGWLFALSFLACYWRRKEWLLWSGAVWGIIFLISVTLMFLRINDIENTEEGIIIKKTEIYSSPRRESLSQGIVPEGRKVVILDSVAGWVAVGIQEKNLKFWIPQEKVGKI